MTSNEQDKNVVEIPVLVISSFSHLSLGRFSPKAATSCWFNLTPEQVSKEPLTPLRGSQRRLAWHAQSEALDLALTFHGLLQDIDPKAPKDFLFNMCL